MSKNNLQFRKTLSNKNKDRTYPKNELVLYRYGVLGEKNRAKGYCSLHKCFISSNDIHEKHCNKKCCKHLIRKNLEVFA